MNDTQTSTQSTTGTASLPPLRRPTKGRMIAGVAAGLGERFDIPIPLVRVGFVILAFFGGFGVLAYLVGWLLIPEEGHDTPVAGELFQDKESLTNWLGIGLIIAAVLVMLSWTNLVRGDFLFAAALLAIGVLLFRGDIGGSTRKTLPADEAPTEDAGSGQDVDDIEDAGDDDVEGAGDTASLTATDSAAVTASLAGGAPEPPAAPSPAAPPPPPPRRRERSMLGGLTFGAILLTLGIMAGLDAAGLTHPSFSHYVAAVVIAAGAGLLVGSLWGRSYGLIAVGLLLLPVLAVSTLVRVPFGAEIGERLVEPVAIAEIGSPVEMAVGDLTIDLTEVERGVPVEVSADLGIGQMTVFVPADRATTVDAGIGIGSLNIFGDQSSGIGRDVTIVRPGDGAADAIHLFLEAGIGEIRVVALDN